MHVHINLKLKTRKKSWKLSMLASKSDANHQLLQYSFRIQQLVLKLAGLKGFS